MEVARSIDGRICQLPAIVDLPMIYLLLLPLLAATFLFVLGGMLSQRRKALVKAHCALADTIERQVMLTTKLCQCAPLVPNLLALDRHIHHVRAIHTLGLPAVGQHIDGYDVLYYEVLLLLSVAQPMRAVEFETTINAFLESHADIYEASMRYNRIALAYNDCQRNTVQYWVAEKMGHQMATPC